jgi:hypothetical protein
MTQLDKRKPLVYIAGPIQSDPVEGCRNALMTAGTMISLDIAVPVVVHTWLMARIMGIPGFPEHGTTKHYERWMAMDEEVIKRCDALFRIPGKSPGADREVHFATEVVNIPVFHYMSDLDKWCQAWEPYV